MDQLTKEQLERVRQIRGRRHAATLPANQRGLLHTASWVDIDFLLSLLDAQTRDTAGLEYHSKECAVDEEGNDCDCGAYRRNQAFLAQRTLLDSDSQAARDEATNQQCSCHKFINLHDGNCRVHGFVRKQESAQPSWEYCPSCGGEMDTGYECNRCGRDWQSYVHDATLRIETETEQ